MVIESSRKQNRPTFQLQFLNANYMKRMTVKSVKVEFQRKKDVFFQKRSVFLVYTKTLYGTLKKANFGSTIFLIIYPFISLCHCKFSLF